LQENQKELQSNTNDPDNLIKLTKIKEIIAELSTFDKHGLYPEQVEAQVEMRKKNMTQETQELDTPEGLAAATAALRDAQPAPVYIRIFRNFFKK